MQYASPMLFAALMGFVLGRVEADADHKGARLFLGYMLFSAFVLSLVWRDGFAVILTMAAVLLAFHLARLWVGKRYGYSGPARLATVCTLQSERLRNGTRPTRAIALVEWAVTR